MNIGKALQLHLPHRLPLHKLSTQPSLYLNYSRIDLALPTACTPLYSPLIRVLTGGELGLLWPSRSALGLSILSSEKLHLFFRISKHLLRNHICGSLSKQTPIYLCFIIKYLDKALSSSGLEFCTPMSRAFGCPSSLLFWSHLCHLLCDYRGEFH